MRLRPFRLVPVLVAVMLLLVPALAAAQGEPTDQDIAMNTLLVFFAAVLVLFMQAGFAMLEVGLSRMKNAGAVMGKILINLSITLLMFWAVGFAFAFGTGNNFIGSSGWFMDNGNPGPTTPRSPTATRTSRSPSSSRWSSAQSRWRSSSA